MWHSAFLTAALGVVVVAAASAVVASLSTPRAAVPPAVPNAPVAPRPTPGKPPPAKPVGYAFDDHRIDTPIVFCIDDANAPQVEPETRQIMVQAVALWQAAANNQLPIMIGDGCRGTGAHRNDGTSVVAWEPLAGAVVGQARYSGSSTINEADIVLDSQWTDAGNDCLLAMALHELGHVLGLGHQDDTRSIMNPVTDCRPWLSPRDIDAVRHLYQ